MTKFYATVCLPPTAPRKVPKAVAAAMAPYDLHLGRGRNPVGRWDGWAIRAGAGGAFLALPRQGDAYFDREHAEARLWSVRGAVPGYALLALDVLCHS